MENSCRGFMKRLVPWALTGLTLTLALMLIVGCLLIYQAGNAPENLTESGVRIADMYSREIAAQRLAYIVPVALVWFIFLILGCFFGWNGSGKDRPSDEDLLAMLRSRVEQTAAMEAQQKARNKARWITGLLLMLCAVPVGMYLLNREHFASWDLEQVMGAMLLHVLPWVVLGLVIVVICEIYCSRSYTKELTEARQAPKTAPSSTVSEQPEKMLTAVRVALFALGIGLIAAGILNGGMYDVLVKAINICTECIGLG